MKEVENLEWMDWMKDERMGRPLGQMVGKLGEWMDWVS